MNDLMQVRSLPVAHQNMQVRRMSLTASQLRFSGGTDGKPFTFTGYAVKWDSVNEHNERFLKGAFADLIASQKRLHMYYNHSYLCYWDYSPKYRIGKWIEIIEDDIGLKVTGELTPNLALANDIQAMLLHGTVDGLSIGFYLPSDLDYIYDNKGVKVISRVDAYEISVVDEPSDKQARIDTAVDVSQVTNTRDAAKLMQRFGVPPHLADELVTRLSKIAPNAAPSSDPDPFAFLDGD